MSKAEGHPAHLYPSIVRVLQYGNIYKKFQVLETNPHKLIFRPVPRKNQHHQSPKEISDPRTFDYPPKDNQEMPPAPNRQNQSKNKQKIEKSLKKTYLSSCGSQSPNSNLARSFPETLKKRSLQLLNFCHLHRQTFVRYILKTIQSGKINCADTKKISNKPLEGNRGRVVIWKLITSPRPSNSDFNQSKSKKKT